MFLSEVSFSLLLCCAMSANIIRAFFEIQLIFLRKYVLLEDISFLFPFPSLPPPPIPNFNVKNHGFWSYSCITHL